MSHRFWVSTDQVSGGDRVTFSAEQWHQMRAVLRLRAGDTVRIFDGRHPVDQEVALTASAVGHIQASHPQPPEPRTRLVVYPALLQREKFESVLQKLTEVGAAAIVPVLAARSLVREPPDERRQTRWRAIMREAAEQCGRGVVPGLLPPVSFAEAVGRAAADGTVVMAYEAERRRSLADALQDAQACVSLLVGPEGGFEATEVARAQEAGARLVTLGPRILRAETASPVLAALVLYELGDLSSAHDDDV